MNQNALSQTVTTATTNTAKTPTKAKRQWRPRPMSADRRPKRDTKEQATRALMVAFRNNVDKNMEPHKAASMACMWARAVLLRDLQGEDVTTFKAEIDLILGWAEEQRRSKEQAKVQHRRPKRGTKEQAMMALMIAYQNNVHKGMQPHMAASRACMWARAVLLCDLQGEDAIAFEFEIDLISDTAEEQRREEWDAQQAKKPNFRPRKPEPAFSPTRRETALKEPSNRPGLSREEQEKRAAAKKALRRQRAEASAQASAHLDASMIEKPGDQRKQAMERIANKAKKGGDGDGKKGKKGKKK